MKKYLTLILILAFVSFTSASTTITDTNINTTGNITGSYYCNLTNCYQVSDFLSASGDNSSWNESHADTKYILQSNEGNLNVNNSNSTNWWSDLSSWLSGWLVNNAGTLEFNETKLNNTIDSRDSDTTYSHLSNFTDDINASSSYNATYDAKADYQFTNNNFNGSGNVTASYFFGDGSQLTGVSGNSSWNQSYADTLYAPNTTAGIQSLLSNQNINMANLTLTQKITFTFGEIIDNIVDGWIKITGNLNVTGNGTIVGTSFKVNNQEVCLADGTNCAGGSGTPTGTEGAIQFYESGDFGGNASKLFFNATTGRLGIGTTSPIDSLHVVNGFDLEHTSTKSDDHAFEIDFNAAGFGDAKAIDIAYTTGAISQGKDEGVILVNIDESAATGGDVFGLEVLATEGSANLYGLMTGILIDPVGQFSGTFGNMDSADNNGVDNLAAFTSTSTDVAIFSNDNDYVTLGDAEKFEEIGFLLDTVSSTNINPTFEYSTGEGTWATFTPTDGTNGMRNNGVILWLDSDIPSWATSGGEYLIRITRTRNNVITTPIEDKVQISAVTEYKWDKDGNLFVNEVNSSLIKIASNTTALTCDSGNEGAIYYDGDSKKHYGCNSTDWNALY